MACWPEIANESGHILVNASAGQVQLWISAWDPPADQLQLVWLNSRGQISFEQKLDLHSNENLFLNTTIPADQRGLLWASCACFVYANLDSAGLDATWGNATFVTSETHTIHLDYTLDFPQDLVTKKPLQDAKQFNMSAATMHWYFGFNFDLQRGDVNVSTPMGRQLLHFVTDGRTLTEGNFSRGYRPAEVGPWSIQLQGYGWFDFSLQQFNLTKEGWEFYNLK